MRALNIASTGVMAQQRNLEVISNNLANQTTTAYKHQRAEFQDLLYQDMRRVGTRANAEGDLVPAGIQLGLGVKTGAVYRIMGQGTITETENALDIALQGRGFFIVEQPNGADAYTRAGSFQLSPDGEIVTQDGYVVSPGIAVPDDAIDISINESGEVEVLLDGQVAAQNLGQLDLASFINENGLKGIGNNLFLETTASGPPEQGFAAEEGYGKLLQGFLEQSNVNPVTEITNMIVAQRAYEMNTKVITAADTMLQALNNAS